MSIIRKYAAVIVLGLLIGLGSIYFGFFHNRIYLNSELVEISNLEKSTKELVLSDGTKVILNTQSSLKFPKEFSRKNRKVTLSGEAYFDVIHLDSKPFIVNTSGVVIEVLGTKFEVKAYPGLKSIETTLLQGSVKISRLNPKTKNIQSVILTPNHKATFFFDDERFIMDKINVSQGASWTKKTLVIDNETLNAVLQKIEVRYGVKTSLANDSLGKLRISMSIDDEPLEQVLTIIKKTLPVNTSNNNGVIVFSPVK
jgi:ferric-dicitrate binding protein FerR (iron transport regulator)